MKGFKGSGVQGFKGWMGAAVILCVALCVSAAGAAEFISPDEVQEGMVGYGLTVFHGTEPDTFEVEAVGVLKNRFPKQDLVIIVMRDARLIESNVVAGMSGSPIYFKGRLLGALAYGPVFSKKAVAYVTPIQNMLRELERPTEPHRPWQTVSRVADVMDGSARPVASLTGVVPATATLAVSGFSSERFKLLERLFSPYGFVPVASGGASAGATDGPAAFRPGHAVGVQLMSGDMELTAVGTVTYVDSRGRVLAFGHPFFNIGQTAMPAMTARVHMFMPSVYVSYKLSSPIRQMGSMVQDRQPAIVIDPNRAAPMAPVSVTVENAQTGRREAFHYRVIREQGLTPMLAFLGLLESLDVAEAGPMGDRTFEIGARMQLRGRETPVTLADISNSPLKTFMDALTILENPIVDVVPSAMEFDVKLTNTSRLAWITGARTAARKYKPGDRVPVTVRLRNQKSEEFEVEAGFTLPRNLPMRVVDLEVRGGAGFSQPEAQPRTLDQIVRIMEKRPRGNDLLVRIMQSAPSFAVDGRTLPDLPVFFQKIALQSVEALPQPLMQPPYESVPTDWLLLGAQRLQVEIEVE